MSDRQAGWIRNQSVKGGWVVLCRLCGKHFTQTFIAANTDYSDANRAAIAYGSMHEKSEPHRAALEAFHVAELPAGNSHEELLREVFGLAPRTEIQRRRELAKIAASIARRTTNH